jgi:hypothetical protein
VASQLHRGEVESGVSEVQEQVVVAGLDLLDVLEVEKRAEVGLIAAVRSQGLFVYADNLASCGLTLKKLATWRP